jgi:fumarylacetoacetase
MTWPINRTHDPGLRSWVESANVAEADFPIQNLPYCVFKSSDDDRPRIGTAIGTQILDLQSCLRAGLLDEPALESESLHEVMALPLDARAVLRQRLSEILSDSKWRTVADDSLTPIASAILCLPVDIGDYTDFYASIFHATNVGKLFRPDNPLLPNYKYVPIGYHGRASSIVASGTNIRRPHGQRLESGAEAPVFGPTRSLDYELEAGFFIGRSNTLGHPIPVARAQEHIFGLCLLNDWSARDIQSWEYQPLGPFLSKSFASSISPWVITMEALAPYRVPAFEREAGDPKPLAYLDDAVENETGGIDLTLEAYLSLRTMRERNVEPMRISHSNLRHLYWTPGQLVAHHASNGCNLRTGDLVGTGTVSGPGANERGCLLEITRRGVDPLHLPTGETRVFLEDGDEIILRGYCEKHGFARIGLGECRGTVLPAGDAE